MKKCVFVTTALFFALTLNAKETGRSPSSEVKPYKHKAKSNVRTSAQIAGSLVSGLKFKASNVSSCWSVSFTPALLKTDAAFTSAALEVISKIYGEFPSDVESRLDAAGGVYHIFKGSKINYKVDNFLDSNGNIYKLEIRLVN